MLSGYYKCCIPCKPPKRYPGCQDHCPEFAKGKVKHDADKEAINKQARLQDELFLQKDEGVRRAMKNRGKKGVQYE